MLRGSANSHSQQLLTAEFRSIPRICSEALRETVLQKHLMLLFAFSSVQYSNLFSINIESSERSG